MTCVPVEGIMLAMTSEVPTSKATLKLLQDRESWTGGFYELAIQLGPPDDARLGLAVRVLAGAASIEGPWHVQWEPDKAQAANWTVADLARAQLRGLVTLPDRQHVICSVVAVREEHGDDWLDLCLPLEALGRSDSRIGGFPFGEDGGSASLTWRRPIDNWLAGVAGQVGRAVSFRLAVIGFEISGSVRAEAMSDGPPHDRGYGLLLSAEATYLPATM
jgi:hypothetical protein